MTTLKVIRTGSSVLYHCPGCGLEDHDKAHIRDHVDAGCAKWEEDKEWARTHKWLVGHGWIYSATCKVCGVEEQGEYWMNVQAKGWVFLEVYVDGTGQTTDKLRWDWYCPKHQGEGLEGILKG